MSEVSIEAPGYAQQMASAPVPAAGHVFRWLATGSATFETMLQHIERAEHSVALEFYICKPGVVSDRFRIALIAACLRGVHVQLLLDVDDVVYVGSANLDVRSRLINYELMLRLPVPALAEQARACGLTPPWWVAAAGVRNA